MKTVLKIVVGILIATVIVIVGVVVLIGMAANEVSKEIEVEEANDKPTPVTVGKAFTHDGYKIEKGWKVATDELGSGTIQNLRVTNTKAESATPMLTFTFVNGSEKVAEIECNAGELEPKQSTKADCFSLSDSFPNNYTEVRVADMW
jgi:hypothetical protein